MRITSGIEMYKYSTYIYIIQKKSGANALMHCYYNIQICLRYIYNNMHSAYVNLFVQHKTMK